MENSNLVPKHHGFTLLELLFVIAIISILSSVGVGLLRTQVQQSKIDKTVLQIKQLMQAGMTYYLANNCWPSQTSPNPDANCKDPNLDFQQFIPISPDKKNPKNITNAWGYPYKWAATGTSNTLFEVNIYAPTPTLAQRIATELPNATTGDKVIPPDPWCQITCVKAQTTIPKNTQQPGAISLLAAGKLTFNFGSNSSDRTSVGKITLNTKITCPSDQPNMFIALIPQNKTFWTRPLVIINPIPTTDKLSPFLPWHTEFSASRKNILPIEIQIDYTNAGTTCSFKRQGYDNPYDHDAGIRGNNSKTFCAKDRLPAWSNITVNYFLYCCKQNACTSNIAIK
jgi:prepilin-type N-terminal cleavage/methylation domain-containing protein